METIRGKILRGIVVSDRMPKTLVVKVQRLKRHPKYMKQYSVSKRYKAHVPEGEYKAGDTVEISESRPLSKDKHWVVVKKL